MANSNSDMDIMREGCLDRDYYKMSVIVAVVLTALQPSTTLGPGHPGSWSWNIPVDINV